MDNILEIHVDSQELQQFHADERPLWPLGGSVCNVPACNSTKFLTFRQFLNHWCDVHVKELKFVRCAFCRKLFKSNQKARQHHSSAHKGRALTITSVSRDNQRFLDSGSAIPYRHGSQNERDSQRESSKQEAARLRHQSVQDVQIQPPRVYISRDEEVVPGTDGTCRRKRKCPRLPVTEEEYRVDDSPLYSAN